MRVSRSVTVTVAVMLAVAAAGPAGAADDHRHGGAERTGTSAEISSSTFSSGADTAVIARADTYPDALASAVLAGAVDGPVLISQPGGLSDAAADELERLGVENVYVVGGLSSVTRDVRRALGRGAQIEEIDGGDRFETAAQIAIEAAEVNDGIGEYNGDPAVIIASANDFADAMTASPVAYARGLPVLYVTQSALPATTQAALQQLEPERAVVMGGEQAVGSTVTDAIERRGITVERYAGADRFETSAMFSDQTAAALNQSSGDVVLARGDAFPDAITGGPLAGTLGAAILLTPQPRVLGSDARDYLGEHCGTIDDIHFLGGTAALADSVITAATNAADC